MKCMLGEKSDGYLFLNRILMCVLLGLMEGFAGEKRVGCLAF